MTGQVWSSRIGLLIGLAGGVVLMGLAPAFAQSREDQIGKDLHSDKPPLTRNIDLKQAAERDFINKMRTRSIVVEPNDPAAQADRERIADLVKGKPKTNLEVFFDYDSAVIVPKAMPDLEALGHVLSKPEFKGFVFFVNGHTDGKGDPEYNLALSQRRAEAVKQVLITKFHVAPETLIATGFGLTQLKDPANPFADENRRVEIVNTEHKVTADAH